MEITPLGRRVSPAPFRERLSQFRHDFICILLLVRHNLYEQTAGTVLGEFWLIVEPLLFALLNYVLIVALLGVQGDDITFHYLLVSFCFWRLHSVMLETAPRLLIGRADLLKHNTISVFIIVFEMVFTRLAYFMLSFAVAAVVLALNGHPPRLTWLLLPAVLGVQLIFSLSLVMALAAVGTIIRDLSGILGFFVAMWWYLSPGLYGVDRIPERYKALFNLNPFAHLFPAYQKIMFAGEIPDPGPLAVILCGSLVFLALASWLLLRVRYFFYKFL